VTLPIVTAGKAIHSLEATHYGGFIPICSPHVKHSLFQHDIATIPTREPPPTSRLDCLLCCTGLLLSLDSVARSRWSAARPIPAIRLRVDMGRTDPTAPIPTNRVRSPKTGSEWLDGSVRRRFPSCIRSPRRTRHPVLG
jgi:hypothetical protein